MRIGSLRHRITFQTRTVTQDSYGGVVLTWMPILDPLDPAYSAAAVAAATVWAEVNYMSVGTRQYWEAQKANSEAQGVVRIRHRDSVRPTDRIIYRGQVLQILAPFTYDTTRREMRILFKEALD